MNLYATVFGSSAPKYDSDEYITAYKLGGLLVKKGFKVKCGGYYCTMEACSKGALEAGQKALGFPFKGFDPKKPNKYAEITKVETIFHRLESLIIGSDLIVTLPGGLGTLSEITITWMMLQTSLLKSKTIVCCIGPKWKTIMQAISDNMEVKSQDLDLLLLFENIEQFKNEVDNITHKIITQKYRR